MSCAIEVTEKIDDFFSTIDSNDDTRPHASYTTCGGGNYECIEIDNMVVWDTNGDGLADECSVKSILNYWRESVERMVKYIQPIIEEEHQ